MNEIVSSTLLASDVKLTPFVSSTVWSLWCTVKLDTLPLAIRSLCGNNLFTVCEKLPMLNNPAVSNECLLTNTVGGAEASIPTECAPELNLTALLNPQTHMSTSLVLVVPSENLHFLSSTYFFVAASVSFVGVPMLVTVCPSMPMLSCIGRPCHRTASSRARCRSVDPARR